MALKPHLDRLSEKLDWNFDLEDCDRILRVHLSLESPGKIAETLQQHGYQCEELT